MKKTQKKRNDKTIFIIAVILFALAVGLFVGAYARFQSQVTGTAQLATARWHFDAHNPGTQTLNIDLLDDTQSGVTVYNLVTLQGGTKVAQPGSYGQFQIELSTEGSDVGANYNVEFGPITGQRSANFAFYNDAGHSQPLTDFSSTIAAGTTQTVTIYWQWLYDASGVTETDPYSSHYDDTNYAGQSLTLPVIITGYQANPNNP